MKNGIVVKVTKQITVKPVYLVYRYTVIGYKPHLLDRYTLSLFNRFILLCRQPRVEAPIPMGAQGRKHHLSP